jgi:hypothetical protein
MKNMDKIIKKYWCEVRVAARQHHSLVIKQILYFTHGQVYKDRRCTNFLLLCTGTSKPLHLQPDIPQSQHKEGIAAA